MAVYYAERLLYGRPAIWWSRSPRRSAALALAAVARLRAPGAGARARLLVSRCDRWRWRSSRCSRIGVKADVTAIDDKVSDAGFVGALPGDEQRR